MATLVEEKCGGMERGVGQGARRPHTAAHAAPVPSLVDLTCAIISDSISETSNIDWDWGNVPPDAIQTILRNLYDRGSSTLYSNKVFTPELIEKLAPAIHQVYELNLRSCGKVDDYVLEHNCPAWSRIVSLDLSSCPGITSVIPVCEHMPNLKILRLNKCKKLNPEGCAKLGMLKQLEELVITGTQIGAPILKQEISQLDKLRKLDVQGNIFVVSGLKEIVAGCPDITDLCINNLTLDSDQVFEVGKLLKLELLQMSFMTRTDVHGFRCLDTLKKLRKLIMFKNVKGVRNSTVSYLVEMHNLETLDICGSSVNEDCADDLSQCISLTDLRMDGVQLSDFAAMKLTRLTELVTLHIKYSKITDDFIVDGIPRLPKLRALKVVECALSDFAVQELAKTNLAEIDIGGHASSISSKSLDFVPSFENLHFIKFWMTKMKNPDVDHFLREHRGRFELDPLMRTSEGTYLVFKGGTTAARKSMGSKK